MKFLIYLICLYFPISFSELCTPFAVRVTLGSYYTYSNDNENLINILFNTNVYFTLSYF